MAHYAFLNENNIVTEVIVGKDESDTTENWEQFYGAIRNQVCKQTSYHGNIRKNYAGIGFIYDSDRDAFIPPKPFPSWTLVEDTCLWTSPVPMPTDNQRYSWNEQNQSWDMIST